MWQFIKNLVTFCCLCLFIYCWFLILYGRYISVKLRQNLILSNERSFLFKRTEDLKKYNNVDILFLGSSHAFRSFDTRIFSNYGYSTFNLGSTAQTPIQSQLFLNTYFNVLKPKCVVLEVYPPMFESDGLESALDVMINAPQATSNIFSTLMNYKNIKVYNTLCYRFLIKSFFFENVNNGISYTNNGKDKYITGGYVETTQTFNKITFIPKSYKKWMPRADQEKALDEIIKKLKVNGIKLILVQTPISKSLFKYQNFQNDIDSYFKSKGEYYNFNRLIRLNDTTNFFDSHHLTQSGVEIFDRAFIRNCLKPIHG